MVVVVSGVMVSGVITVAGGETPGEPVQPENATSPARMRRIIQVVFRFITTGCPGDY
jgi:hypothetical protein